MHDQCPDAGECCANCTPWNACQATKQMRHAEPVGDSSKVSREAAEFVGILGGIRRGT